MYLDFSTLPSEVEYLLVFIVHFCFNFPIHDFHGFCSIFSLVVCIALCGVWHLNCIWSSYNFLRVVCIPPQSHIFLFICCSFWCSTQFSYKTAHSIMWEILYKTKINFRNCAFHIEASELLEVIFVYAEVRINFLIKTKYLVSFVRCSIDLFFISETITYGLKTFIFTVSLNIR